MRSIGQKIDVGPKQWLGYPLHVSRCVEQAGERLDLIMIPKVGTAADVYAIDMMVTQIETAKGVKKRIGFEHIIESALGMQNVT
jgi:citrate lyase beta subunit